MVNIFYCSGLCLEHKINFIFMHMWDVISQTKCPNEKGKTNFQTEETKRNHVDDSTNKVILLLEVLHFGFTFSFSFAYECVYQQITIISSHFEQLFLRRLHKDCCVYTKYKTEIYVKMWQLVDTHTERKKNCI